PYAVTLDAPLYVAFMKNSKKRELREKLARAFAFRCVGGEADNSEIVKKTARLRFERAQILGFKTHADYVLEERMASHPKNVENFVEKILAKARPKALKELEEVRALMKEMDGLDDLKSWDTAYYSE